MPLPDIRPTLNPLERGPAPHCAIHGEPEPDLEGDYHACGECWHVWRTREAFDADCRALVEQLNNVPDEWNGGERVQWDAATIGDSCCPLCSHDWMIEPWPVLPITRRLAPALPRAAEAMIDLAHQAGWSLSVTWAEWRDRVPEVHVTVDNGEHRAGMNWSARYLNLFQREAFGGLMDDVTGLSLHFHDAWHVPHDLHPRPVSLRGVQTLIKNNRVALPKVSPLTW
jgi:hypothetical protein